MRLARKRKSALHYDQKEFGWRRFFDRIKIGLNSLKPKFLRNWEINNYSGNPALENSINKTSGLKSALTGLVTGSVLSGIIPSGGILFDHKIGELANKAMFKTRNLFRGASKTIDDHFQRKVDRRLVANGEMTHNDYFNKWNM